ncbi:response regulator transcription factor [Sulfitobacter sp. S190]|uniref:response regulator transcription factor n=1 Tax=Sulfitobacter sp. S190 TaxID=2867022 RepID=UPI0021A3E425|nr:response regulator [Sulfitobacter sp. S190]UWR21075.1 response regulator [Sulfitobacter sp. S190]
MTKHVVLVEDETNIAEAIRFLLGREGWRVETLANGTSAAEVIRAARPDLVMLDVMLPGKSGFEILAELRSDTALSDLPVLMLTARGHARDRDMAMQVGASRFMTKPFSNEDMLAAVRELTEDRTSGAA